MVQRTLIRPPAGRIGPLSAAERRAAIESSPHYGKYEDALDRESAAEVLARRSAEAAEADGRGKPGPIKVGQGPSVGKKARTAAANRQQSADSGGSVVRAVVGQMKDAIIRSIFKRR